MVRGGLLADDLNRPVETDVEWLGIVQQRTHHALVQSFLTTIAERIAEEKLPALMIGGHAITALGHPRATFDLDLLIPRSAAGKWKAVLSNLQYRLFAESANFQQYEAPEGFPLPPVDLMLVEEEVFLTLERTKSDTQPIATPGVQAMIALKLHAINQPGRHDVEKDWTDVLALVRAHLLSLDDSDFYAIVLRHGGKAAIQRIRNSCPSGN